MSGLSKEQRAEATRYPYEICGPLIFGGPCYLPKSHVGPHHCCPFALPLRKSVADAEQAAYARGAAEQAVKVEAVLEHFYPVIPLSCWTPDQEAAVVTAHAALQQAMKRDLRAALASEGTDALAKVRADAWDEGWRAAAYEFDTATTVENPYRADRIEAGDER